MNKILHSSILGRNNKVMDDTSNECCYNPVYDYGKFLSEHLCVSDSFSCKYYSVGAQEWTTKTLTTGPLIPSWSPCTQVLTTFPKKPENTWVFSCRSWGKDGLDLLTKTSAPPHNQGQI